MSCKERVLAADLRHGVRGGCSAVRMPCMLAPDQLCCGKRPSCPGMRLIARIVRLPTEVPVHSTDVILSQRLHNQDTCRLAVRLAASLAKHCCHPTKRPCTNAHAMCTHL
jgi:hypothetical protein